MYLQFYKEITKINFNDFFSEFGKLDPPPFGLKIFKGYKNVIMRRDFVEFIINHPVAIIYKDFLKNINVPDEHFYATLSRINMKNITTNMR